MENEDKEGITFVILPSLSQVRSPSQKPKTRGTIVSGLLTPRWLVFLFSSPAEGQLTSGVVKQAVKEKKKLSFSGRRHGKKPRIKTNRLEARRSSSLRRSKTSFFSKSSPWWCEAVKLLKKTEAEFVKGLVYM